MDSHHLIQAPPGDGLKRTIYVFVRTDLPVEQQLVQTAHACAEASRQFYEPHHGIASLIVLAVPGLQGLLNARAKLESLDIEHAMFFEPDWEIGNSAVATRPLLDSERSLLRGHSLWRHRPVQTSRATVCAEEVPA